MKNLSRNRSLLAQVGALASVGVLALGLVSCSSAEGNEGGGNAENKSELKIGSSPSLASLSLQGAIANGHFGEDGLTVEVVPNKSANDAVPQLLNGGIDIAQMDMITFLKARNEGLPIQIVAGAGEQSTDGVEGEISGAGVVANPDSDIEGALDLVGRTVGVPAIKTQTWMNIRAIVDEAGGDSSQIDFVEVPSAQTIDLVNRGQVDASTPSEPLQSSSIAQNKVKLVHSTDVPGLKGAPSSVFVASEDFVTKNPETVENFADSVYTAAAEIRDNPDLAKEIGEKQLNLKPEQLETMFVPALATDHPTAEELNMVIELAVRYEILEAAPELEGAFAAPGEEN
ncbi:Taurine-binding periplasmic protein precursor [Corynebacterium occultum]|uniref:Taurine-binding periplasmic protein n=1 Tax=Corynebacterium occultum TaxID=2675219 RepID=A0A6B8VVQ5_9CORY|nr:ABC transporter substrate-binding protein [Corynebacterium occultum]QGU08223.1 Taurine-binding periplasmic protein precursor [Corynebacterium occultum]